MKRVTQQVLTRNTKVRNKIYLTAMNIVSTEEKNRIHPHKFTMWVAIGSMLMLFAGLTSAYIVKSSQDNWIGVHTPNQFWYSTIVIIMSSITMQMAFRSFKQREMPKYRKLIALTMVLGILFVA